ncbi:MAG: DEAD/DEAH box helicase [Bacilli bacterium]|nr:DEAD/DEAH box helicase [Bacilli bacterium]
MEFKNLGLNNKVLKSIEALNFEKPSEIQEQMIPLILSGKDIIGQAQTGTGKTLAFAASILSKIDVTTNVTKAIILTPTRELAIQVCEEFESLNKDSNFDVLAIYGGSSIEKQIDALRRGVDIVVGTPGRIMDLIKRKKLLLDNLEFFVLDEADEMLNMGFLEDIEDIFKKTNEEKQVLMLSATMPREIKLLATKYMKKDYEHILIKSESKTSNNVEQYYYIVNEKTRLEALCRVLDLKNSKRTIIFCATKRECDELLTNLSLKGYKAEAMHGDITQDMRIKALDRFKKNSFKVLIATDVAARGIHVDNIECVINYKLPQDYESYIHRIGRTGRAGNVGEAINLVNNRDLKFLQGIEKFASCKINKQELPTKEEIIKIKYENILKTALEISNEEKEEAMEYVRDLNKGDLLSLSCSLLKMFVDKEIGSNLEQNLDVKEDHVRNVKSGYVRVFITIGTKDRLKKGSLLDFLKAETGINKDCFKNIEVLSTFTFIDVDEKVLDEFAKKIQNKKFNNRIIRIERAKRQR